MKRLLDLRFVIGVFFLVIGALLVFYSFMTFSKIANDINTWCGAVFIGFSIFMLVLSFRKPVEPQG